MLCIPYVTILFYSFFFFFLNCILVHGRHSIHVKVREQHRGVCSLHHVFPRLNALLTISLAPINHHPWLLHQVDSLCFKLQYPCFLLKNSNIYYSPKLQDYTFSVLELDLSEFFLCLLECFKLMSAKFTRELFLTDLGM